MIEGKVLELVIAYKNRLARFGYEVIEDSIKDYSGERSQLCLKKKMSIFEMKLFMVILNVFMAKINGLHRYKKLTIGIKNYQQMC